MPSPNDFPTIFKQAVKRDLEFNVPLGKFTTMGIGGPAQYFFTANTSQEMVDAVRIARAGQIPVMVMGAGSNMIVSDEGYRGLVIRNNIKSFRILEGSNWELNTDSGSVTPRLEQIRERSAYQVDQLKPSFSRSDEMVIVQIGSGWRMNDLIQHLFKFKLTGLEWFAGIPGSLGGAIFMNMHGGTFFWSHFVHSVRVIDLLGRQKRYSNQEMEFDYDYSKLHMTRDIILNAEVTLFKGDVKQANKIFAYWARKKIANQPQKSAGCVWQNLTTEQKRKIDQKLAQQVGPKQFHLPTSSVGYFIEEVLKQKGTRVGGAQIAPQHCAFIENTGTATAKDVMALTEKIEQLAFNDYGIVLHREVEFVG